MEASVRKQYPAMQMMDGGGNVIGFQINNGIKAEYTGTTIYNFTKSIQPYGFYIIPLVAGKIEVQLFNQDDGDSYVISTEEVGAYTGKILPYRIRSVIAGSDTTVNRMKIVW